MWLFSGPEIKKAFDTVNHEILLRIMEIYGIYRFNALNFINYYLTGHKQLCQLNGVMYTDSKIGGGIPQGPILGPLLQ
jgi:hypothetical protein